MTLLSGRPVVGITGGIGSGKTAVTDLLANLGITIVDADLASRLIMQPGKPALAAVENHFGASILLPDGQLDRAALRALVFADPAERSWLEALTHPLIGQEIQDQLAAATSPYVVLSSPLLLETSQRELCDCVVVVDVPASTQLERTMARDNNDAEQVRRIMAAQLEREARIARADEVIDNSGTLEDLQERVRDLHQRLLLRFGLEQD
jgi:dephospho-CoA kinase